MSLSTDPSYAHDMDMQPNYKPLHYLRQCAGMTSLVIIWSFPFYFLKLTLVQCVYLWMIGAFTTIESWK